MVIDDIEARRIDIAVGNLENGALVRGVAPGLHGSRGYDLRKLLDLFEPVRDRPPAVIGLCEGKEWSFHGGDVGNAAVNMLARFLGRSYVIEFGHVDRGPAGPVVIYDPDVVRVDVFADHGGVGVWNDSINLVKFHLADDPSARLWFKIDHWDYVDGDRRLAEAKRINALAAADVPVVFGGDLNCTASGSHLPQRRWDDLPMHARVHKAWQPDGPGTSWVADTRPLDYLIGTYVEQEGQRVDGIGFHAACEIAHRAGVDPGRAFRPTLNRGVDHDTGEIVNDWALLNERAAPLMIPDSYAVHLHDGDGEPPSDHGLITLALAL